MQNSKVARAAARACLFLALMGASWLAGTSNCAAVTTPTSTPTSTPTATPTATGPQPAVIIGDSEENFQGDRLTFPGDMNVKVSRGDLTHPRDECIKAGTTLRGVGKQGDTVYFVVTSCSPLLGFLSCSPGYDEWWCRKDEQKYCDVLCEPTATAAAPVATETPGAGGNTPTATPTHRQLEYGAVVAIPLAEVAKIAPNRYGLAYGTLVVPFKFQLTGAHQFTGSATLGPYLGYKFDTQNYGLATTLALFGGISNIAVDKTTTDPTTMMTSTSTEQIAGFGYGGGVLLEIKGGFQAGAVIGFDSVGNGQNFQYNNQPWLALELGYSFSQ